MPDVVLKVNGEVFGGWKSLRVERSLERCAGMFSLGLTELWPDSALARNCAPGDACVLTLDGVTVVTGYVDQVGVQYSDSDHSVSVEGRDRTADLVDCSAIRPTGGWQGSTVLDIARDLARPFEVSVVSDVDIGGAFPQFALQQGETAFEAIERLARTRALLVTSTPQGNLLLTRPGTTRVATALVLGQNILEGSGTLSHRERFSEYVFKGQAAGGDFFSGRDASQMSAKATDPAVRRYRPLLVLGESQDVAASMRERALWEANVRAARSQQIQYKVQGWAHSEGLWAVNTLVTVRDPWLRLDQELLIKRVAFSLDESGSFTELELTRSDAFQALPLRQAPAPAAAAGGGFFWDQPAAGASQNAGGRS
jgi:prophage tail gpP-like protein